MTTIDDVFYNCCKNNEVDKALQMIREGVKDYCGGFIGFCKSGNIDMVKHMIKLSSETVDYNYGLRTSSYCGHHDLVVYLLSIGACDVNGALYTACKGGNANICKILMNDYKAKIFNKGYVIEIARKRGHDNIVDILIK